MKRLLKKCSERFISAERPGAALAVVIAASIVLPSLTANASAGSIELVQSE
jgi:hypothetical protein